jgi:hypothetical protein
MGNPSGLYSVFQGPGDMVLADNIIEALGPPSAGKNAIAHFRAPWG